MQKSLFFIAFLSFVFYANGQSVSDKKSLKGRITNSKGEGISFATLTLHLAKDSSLVKAGFTDEAGYFEMAGILPNKYFISASSVSYQKLNSQIFELKNKSEVLEMEPIVLLESKANNLDEVVIVKKKPFIERQLDKIIVNVEGSIVSAGSTALEVLERAPGVVVNQETAINLMGKQGVIIMIDGRPSPLQGADLINYLKGVPSSNIERIEIISNPSSKYDAAGNAGIIDIHFKKDKNQGFNGSVTLSAGQGVYLKPNASTNVNYRKGKFNLYGNYSYGQPKNFTKFYINRQFFDENRNILSIFDQDSYIVQPIKSQNAKFGVDFFANKKTVMGLMFNNNWFTHNRDGNTNSLITNALNELLYTTKTNNVLDEKRLNGFANFNLKHTFDSTGRELTFDFDLGKYSSDTQQSFSNDYFSPNNSLINNNSLFTNQEGVINVKSAKADYTQPLKNKGKIEAGVKSSFVKTDNDILFYNVVSSEQILDKTQSNHFIYDENVNAAYFNFAKEHNKFDYQLGVRVEQTITNGKQLASGESFSRNYAYLFPTAFFNYKLNEKNQASFSYSRRIDRPSYRNLNPFRIFVDPYTYVVGDPTLKPSLTDAFEISHTFASKYVTTFNYSRSKDIITDVFSQDDTTKVSYQIPANIQNLEQFYVSTTVPFQPISWINTNLTVSGYWSKYASPLQGGNLLNQSISWDFRLQNTFSIGKKGWSAELNGFYQSQNAWGLFVIKSLGQASIGVQKISANKLSTFKLAMADILKTNRIAVVVDYQNQKFHTMRTWDSQVLTFSFTHRFGKNTVARARQRTTGIEDLKQRAN